MKSIRRPHLSMGACCYWICPLGKRLPLRMSPRSLGDIRRSRARSNGAAGRPLNARILKPCSHDNPGVQFNRHLREALSGAVNGALSLQPEISSLNTSQNPALFCVLNNALNDENPELLFTVNSSLEFLQAASISRQKYEASQNGKMPRQTADLGYIIIIC